jgi:hypothetical protein
MKKLINFLPAMAILLASGLAVATTSFTTYNVRNTNPAGQPPNWVPIGPSEVVNCDDHPSRYCKAYEDEDGIISNAVFGNEI